MIKNTPIWLSQYDNVNVFDLLDNIWRNGYLGNVWEGNEHGEKGI